MWENLVIIIISVVFGGVLLVFTWKGLDRMEKIKKEEEDKIAKGLMRPLETTYDTMGAGIAVMGVIGILFVFLGLLLLMELLKKTN